MAKSKVEYWLTKDGLTLLGAWARDGLTDEQIAQKMEIHPATLYDYKKKYPEISESLKKNKDIADVEIENELYKSAQGQTITLKKPIKVKEEKQVQGKGKVVTERIEYVDEEIFIPANVTAQIYWLNNRKPEQWRNKHKAEITKIEAETELTKSKTAILNSEEENPAIETLTEILKELRNNAINEETE